jgi:lysophospholipase L1-like esterase
MSPEKPRISEDTTGQWFPTQAIDAAPQVGHTQCMEIRANDTILFQGDSVTDAGRDKQNAASLGSGYPLLVAGRLQAVFPELELTFLNRGVSGDRTKDLLNRWKTDCLDLKPDVLSILVGINNTWRRFDQNDPTAPEQFESEYGMLLEQARSRGVREIVILEPFLLEVQKEHRQFREDLDPKIAICRRLAREFHASYLPLDGEFNGMATRIDPLYWTTDGIHPTPAGHRLIAERWFEKTMV